jgi:hypothetical protein
LLRGRFPGVKKNAGNPLFSDSFQFRAATLQYEIQLKHYDYEKVHDSSRFAGRHGLFGSRFRR